jgi:hypothetical protein
MEREIESQRKFAFLAKPAKLVFAPQAESTTHPMLRRIEADRSPLFARFSGCTGMVAGLPRP